MRGLEARTVEVCGTHMREKKLVFDLAEAGPKKSGSSQSGLSKILGMIQ